MQLVSGGALIPLAAANPGQAHQWGTKKIRFSLPKRP